MRIRIVQSGGLAGLRLERVVETERLPDAGREALEGLVRTSAFFELPERRVSGLPDVIQYRVRVEASGRAHEVTFDDETASGALRDLVTRALADRDA
ncbi:MAG: hypothetical protein E6K81_16640 [Candidatus Eisenbacteria bacterium]|uniref:Uncharacterized protein n=1 Tax=Eiseniibacteriota bacterium TaxID=2212470 RepID=A0A538TXG5_UNCEI|nr:MAG: hypothetical protein E6K81_16640 [Candidatus Eisenbacteria bacterium]